MNENRDGNGRNIFTKVSRGVYRLKTLSQYHPLETWFKKLPKIEEQEFHNGIKSKLSKLNIFLDIISKDGSTETEVGNYLKNEPWIFSLEYLKASSEDKIGLNGRTDFLLEKTIGEFDLVELKGPNEKIFIKSDTHDYSRLSAKSKDALSQMINYLSKYDKYYLFQKEETKRDVLYPQGIIVIGRENDTDRQALSSHNNFLNRIKFTTYDHLIQSCQTSLLNIEKEYD